MLNDYGNEVNISFAFREEDEQRSLSAEAARSMHFRQKQRARLTSDKTKRIRNGKKNKTDCVGFMQQNRDN